MKPFSTNHRGRQAVKTSVAFLRRDIWRIRSEDLPKTRAAWVRPLRVIVLSFHKFKQDTCMLRASALTFYSLLSIVPVLAMAFGIAKGFGFEKALETQLLARLQAQEQVITHVMGFANSLLENTKGGVIAGTGVLILLWTIMTLLGNIESAFNRIWEVDRSRSLARKISDYFSAMVVCPLLLVLSSGATVIVISQVTLIIDKISFLGAFGSAILFVLKILPWAVIWSLFIFMYMFMPNRKIHFASAAVAGITAGTLYQLFQWAYLSFQFGVTRYNAIYGSFAALPLFLIWLQISWLIVLFGAEVSFAHQNQEKFELEPDYSHINHRLRTYLALRVVHLLVKDFTQGKRPLTASQIAQTLDLPLRLTHRLLSDLVASELVSVICEEPVQGTRYQPAEDPDRFTIAYVVKRLESIGVEELPRKDSWQDDRLFTSLKTFQEAIRKSPANMKLKEI